MRRYRLTIREVDPNKTAVVLHSIIYATSVVDLALSVKIGRAHV